MMLTPIFLSLRFSLSMTIVAVIGGCAVAEGIRLNVDPVGWCMANYEFYPPAERKVYCETTFLAERNQQAQKSEQDARETREAWGQLLGAVGQYQQNKTDRKQAQQEEQQRQLQAQQAQQRRMQDQQNSAYVAEAARAEARRKAHHPENVANNCVHVIVDKFKRQVFHNNCPWPVSIKWPAGIWDLRIGGTYPTMQDGPFSYFACKYDRNSGAGIGPGGNICTN